MFAKLRNRIARWIDPEAAAMAAALEASARAAMHNQHVAIVQTEALRARCVKGTIFDYQIGLAGMRGLIQYQNWKAMHTLCLPAPAGAETNELVAP